jgi:hypothetical protein
MFCVRNNEEICKEIERLTTLIDKAISIRDHANKNNFTPVLIKHAELNVEHIRGRIDALQWVLLG